MTDAQIAAAVIGARNVEALARAAWTAADRDDLAERDAALVVVRKVTEVRVVLERWITVRAVRAVQQ